MDRLNEISRAGGYPWVAEEISIIEKHADYINALLDSMKLPGGSCVFVQRNETQQGKLAKSVVYIVQPTQTNGELFYLEADSDVVVSALIDGTATKKDISITTESVDVTGDQTTEYNDCYVVNTAELATGDTYTFYDLNDLLRPAVWENLQDYLFPTAAVSETSVMSLYEDYEQLFRKSGQEIEVDLQYVVTGNILSQNVVKHEITGMDLGLGEDVKRQLNGICIRYTTNLMFTIMPIRCYIDNEGIWFRGISAESHQSDSTTPNDEVHVFGRVSIK